MLACLSHPDIFPQKELISPGIKISKINIDNKKTNGYYLRREDHS